MLILLQNSRARIMESIVRERAKDGIPFLMSFLCFTVVCTQSFSLVLFCLFRLQRQQREERKPRYSLIVSSIILHHVTPAHPGSNFY